jgi:molybdopterin molybdotransferase
MPALLQAQTDVCSSPATGDLVSVEQALAIGLAEARPIAETELIDLDDAAGRILAQAVKADSPLPRFDYSAMDGYAVDTSTLTAGLPGRLRIAGTVAANRTVGHPVLQHGCTFRILTGAPIPAGADAVVVQEDVEREGDHIFLSRAPKQGDNIRRRGEDVLAGETLLEAGTLMGPVQAGVAAALGHPGLRMFRRLRVAIFTNGSELRQPGENLRPGEIYDSNRFILRSLLAEPWIDIIDLGTCIDRPSDLREILQTAAARADVIICAGSISVGDEDHIMDAFRRCGGKLHVRKVAMKPGKPVTLGRIADATFVGLPGNPGALFTTFKVIVERILRLRAGMKSAVSLQRSAIAAFEYAGRRGLTTYLPAVVAGDDAGLPVVAILPNANSGKLQLLNRAQGFVVIEPDTAAVTPGQCVRWMPFQM